MLEIACVDRVENPVEAEDWVDDHGEVVVVRISVATDVAEEVFVGVWLQERPVHENVPDS